MAAKPKKWSAEVNAKSDAMDVAGGTFKQRDPKKIARALEHDAERSTRRKSSPYRSAMSMLTFYINRAGSNLSAEQRDLLERAKAVLRQEFGPEAGAKTAKTGTAKAAKSPKAPAKRAAAKRPRAAAAAKPAAKRKRTSSKD
jgi:hypothetical protein